ncbi:hypothetical protein [Arboricoccus pini]|uniref:hypothetical protein n=1 Tax=Arboricoccus pini TaxID=1963835 RepID=UPI0010545EBB|nr:hypothetical protein [Arboricoccus pini]
MNRLLKALPEPNGFTAATRLQRRLLLATAPVGEDGDDALRLRIARLLAIGDVEAARLLIMLATALPADDPLRQDVALASGDGRASCDGVNAMRYRPPTNAPLTLEPPAERALRLNSRLVCIWLADGGEHAAITAKIAMERQDPNAAGYRQVLSLLQNGDVAGMLRLDPPLRDLALLSLSGNKARLAKGAVPALPHLLQARLADNDGLSPDARLAAALAAASVGALPPATLRTTLAADPGLGPKLAAIDDAKLATVKAERLRDAWKTGPGGPAQLIWAQALSLDVQTTDPSLETVAAAEAAVPISVLAGDQGRLTAWRALLAFLSRDRADVRAAATALDPYLRLADAGQAEGADAADLSPAAEAYLAALGRATASAGWLSAPFDQSEGLTPAQAAARAALDQAVLAGGKASVAATALALLGDRPESLPLATRVDVLSALRHAGFAADAVQLAAAFLIAEPADLSP